MKQGTLINRIVMLLLLAAVLVYLGVSAWRSFRDPYTLVLSYAYTVDDSLEATGFLVREERVLASPGGIVDLLPEEGEKVSRGETVALLYQNDSGLARKEELQSLTMEKEQLQYALERTQSGGDSSQLSQQVIDAIVALRSSVSTGDLTRLEDETLLLKSLVYKRDFTFNGGEEDGDAAASIQASIDAVDAQIAALSAQAAQDTSRLTADQAGSFPDRPTAMRACSPPVCWRPSPPASSASSTASGPSRTPARWASWITDATWYFVCAMGEEEAGRLIEGRTVTVRFSRDWSGEVDMKVERVGETPENGRVTVVLSSDRYLSETTLLRKQTVELVFDSQTGIRVPTQSVRVEERTVTDPETEEEKQELVTGVYVLVGQQAEFKPVTILAQLEDFALVKSADGSDGKKALRAGDEVILSSVELFDGKVITQS
ncbi:MAG: HlyD family efflux transporter periplasmic adaptor subunit [Flavonifractor plautii]